MEICENIVGKNCEEKLRVKKLLKSVRTEKGR